MWNDRFQRQEGCPGMSSYACHLGSKPLAVRAFRYRGPATCNQAVFVIHPWCMLVVCSLSRVRWRAGRQEWPGKKPTEQTISGLRLFGHSQTSCRQKAAGAQWCSGNRFALKVTASFPRYEQLPFISNKNLRWKYEANCQLHV